MTQTNIQNLLSPDEIKALLNKEDTSVRTPMTSLINGGQDLDCGNAVAEAFNRALMGAYLIDADCVFCGYNPPKSDQNGLCYEIKTQNDSGYIFFSAEFITETISRILGGHNTKKNVAPLITPAAEALMSELADIICRSASGILTTDQNIWTCTGSPARQTINKEKNIPLCFSVNQEKIWLLPPEMKPCPFETDDRRRGLKNTAVELPVTANAVVSNVQIPLRQLCRWQVGDFLPLGIEKNAEISILCGNKTVFKGILGQKLHRIAVKITKKVP